MFAKLIFLLLVYTGLTGYHFVVGEHQGYKKGDDDKIAVRDYCDDQVYFKHNLPSFIWNPRPYMLPYYKRCINHDDWVDCIITQRKKPDKGVIARNFEKMFPAPHDMIAAGIVLCDMRLHAVPPNKTNCHFNTTMCNRVWETGNDCEDSNKKIVCIWGQLSKCGMEDLKPLLDYEFGLLGGKCLQQLKRGVYPHARSLETCEDMENSKQPLGSLTLSWLLSLALGAKMSASVMAPTRKSVQVI